MTVDLDCWKGLDGLLPPTTKLGQGNVFTGICDSVNIGVCLSACWNTTPPPHDQAPPGTRHPPPPEQSMLGDTVNERVVRILLECNIVFSTTVCVKAVLEIPVESEGSECWNIFWNLLRNCCFTNVKACVLKMPFTVIYPYVNIFGIQAISFSGWQTSNEPFREVYEVQMLCGYAYLIG